MKRLTSGEEMKIRSWLDEMENRLYHNVLLPEDYYMAHKMIKRLLLDIYMLQLGMEEREVDTRGKAK